MGLLPRSIHYVWNKIQQISNANNNTMKFTIRAGYLEIYNEKVMCYVKTHFVRCVVFLWVSPIFL